MRTNHLVAKVLAVVAVAAMSSTTAFTQQSTVVYSNVETPLNQTFSAGDSIFTQREFGDEVKFSLDLLGDGVKTLTEFQFDYLGNFTDVGVGLARIYFNTAVGNAPELTNIIFESAQFSLANGFNSVAFTLDQAIPDEAVSFTWTVRFVAEGSVGLVLYDPPTIGGSANDIWFNDVDNGWQLRQLDGGATAANFGAVVSAVPEPGTISLFALTFLGLFAGRFYTGRKN